MIGRTNSVIKVIGSGGSPALDGLPSDWPDIHAIVKADVQSGYSYKYIYLLADDYTYLDLTKTGNAVAFKTSDGAFYTATTTHNWNTALDFDCSEGYKTRWVIVYTDTENITVSLPYEVLWVDMYSAKGANGGFRELRKIRAIDGLIQTGLTDMSSMFVDCLSLTRVPDVLDTSSAEDVSSMFSFCPCLTSVPDVLDLSSATNVSSMFSDCYSLTRVPDVLDTSSATRVSSMFYSCYSLTSVPDVLDLSSATNMSSMFASCQSLTRVPDVLDLSSAISVSYMFGDCYSLTRVPDVLDTSSAADLSSMFGACPSLTRVPDVLDLSSAMDMSWMFGFCFSLTRVPSLTIATGSLAAVAPDFAQSTRVNAENRDSVATFSGSTVTGGLVGNLPSVTATRRLTLNSTIKALFTPTEQGYVASDLTSKNWTLTW